MRLRTIIQAAIKLKNPWTYFVDRCGGCSVHYTLSLRHGPVFRVRGKHSRAVCDAEIAEEVLLEDIYRVEFNIGTSDVVVDIGAHIGMFSVLAAYRAFKGKVIAFEPEPENFRLLQENATLNGLSNLTLDSRAVGENCNPTSIFVSAENTGGHSVFPLPGSANRVVTVESTTLPKILEQYHIERINVLKIDCEGSEYSILLNAPSECLRRIDKLLIEQHLTPAIAARHQVEPLREHLRSCGFSVSIEHDINYEGEGRFWLLRAENSPPHGGERLKFRS